MAQRGDIGDRPSPFEQPDARVLARQPSKQRGASAAAAAHAPPPWLWLAVPWGLGGLLGALLPPSLDREGLSPLLGRLSSVIGWVFFSSWGISVYPQLWHNFVRKSAAGLSMDFLCLNLAGFLCFGGYNCSLLWSSAVREQYAQRHRGGTPAVHLNDALLPIHACLIMLLTIAQCIAYGRRSPASHRRTAGASPARLSGAAAAVLAALAAAVLAYAAAVWAARDRAEPGGWLSLLGLVYFLGYIKIGVTLVKYVPQLLLNRRLRSTRGFAVWSVLLDCQGGVLALMQQAMDAIALKDWAALTGNPVKFALSWTVLGFHSVFLTQHYVLYRGQEPLPLQAQPSLLTGRLSGLLTGRPSMALEAIPEDEEVQLAYAALPALPEGEEWEEEQGEEGWPPPLLTAPSG